MKRTARLLTVLAGFAAFGLVLAATDIPQAGKPTPSNGAVWGLKTGTTNTLEAIEADGSGGLKVSTTPSGTQDINQKQVNGATINVGTGAAGTGTQRVTTSTDSTIGTVTTITNAVTVAQPTASNLNATVTGSGTAGTPAAGVLTVQGASGNTPLLVAPGASGTGADATGNTLVAIPQSVAGVNQTSGFLVAPKVFNGTTWDRMPGSTTGIFTQGNVASDVPVTANPMLMGGRASAAVPTAVSANGDAVAAWLTTSGATVSAPGSPSAGADAITANIYFFNSCCGGAVGAVGTAPHVYNGSTMDRQRSAGVGNAVASTGLAASTPYGNYTTNANQPAMTTGQYSGLQTDPAGNLRTAPQRPTAADILAASVSVTSTTASTALITVTAGRTWVGDACISVQGSKAAAATGNGEVLGSFLTAGTNVTPAAGTYFEVDTAIGANAATGTVGTQGSNQGCTKFTLVAPAGNTVTLNYAATCTSTTACRVSASANGVMQ